MAQLVAPSVVELAEICEAVYFDRSEVPVDLGQGHRGRPANPVKWSRVGAPWTNLVGFHAGLYERQGCCRVLAFRGTDDLWDTLVDDVAVAAGSVPPQVLPALIVARSVAGGTPLFITGHSLGGALAIIASAQVGAPAVSFNAPGVMETCMETAPLAGGIGNFFKVVARCLASSRMLNIRIAYDPVSSIFTTGMQAGFGKVEIAAPSCGIDLLCRHAMTTVLQSVRAKESYYEPTQF